jgi:invasion protein IalB
MRDRDNPAPWSKTARLGGVLLASLLAASPAAGQLRGGLETSPGEAAGATPAPYHVRPVEGAPPLPGIRRLIQRFCDWTLICDEEKRKRICKASQSIVGPDGELAFSWSLAATRGGEPVFLIRAPVMEFPAHTVILDFGAGERVIRLATCDARLCVGFLPVDPPLAARIKARSEVSIRYRLREGAAPVALTTSLDGLAAAIAGIP